MKRRRSLAKAMALSGYTRTRLQSIFRAAGEHPCTCSIATFRRVLREHLARPHGNCELITIDGESLTITQWAERAEVNAKSIYRRAKRLEWSIERTIRESLRAPGRWSRGHGPTDGTRRIELDGESLTIAQWAGRAGVPPHVLRGRASHFGWSMEHTVRESIARPGVWTGKRASRPEELRGAA